MRDEDWQEYWRLCIEQVYANNLQDMVDNPQDQCPLSFAENTKSDAAQYMFDCAAYITGVTSKQAINNFSAYLKMIPLIEKLVIASCPEITARTIEAKILRK